MHFNFAKAFSGSKIKSGGTVLGVGDLGRLFTGQTAWGQRGELEQYHKSLYVFAAVNKIASKVASIDLDLYKITSADGESEEVLVSPILDLLAKPNPFQTKSEFLKTAWINKKLCGEAFWYKVRDARGQVTELWNLRPDCMTVVTDPEKYLLRYEFAKPSGGVSLFEPIDIIHFKDPDPLNAFRGLSAVRVARTRIETEQGATEFQRTFFRNNARPDALLITEETLDHDQRSQMTSAWDEEHRGTSRSSKIGILEGGMKYQQVSVTQREMDYIESAKFTRDDILVAFGVPKSVVTTDDVNYANAQAGMRMFLTETINPEMAQLIEVLNELLVTPDYGEEYYLDYKDPTPMDRDAERADNAAGYAKWLTTNEIRTTINLPAIEGGDVIATPPQPSAFGGGPSMVNQPAPAEPAEPAKYIVDYAKRKHHAAKLLRGRPNLRAKFAISLIIKEELEGAMQKRRHTTRTKSEQPIKARYITLFPDIDGRRLYYDVTNKRIDATSVVFEKKVMIEAASQEKRVLARLSNLSKQVKKVESRKLQTSDIASILNAPAESKLWAEFALPFMKEFALSGGKTAAKMTNESFSMSNVLKKKIDSRAKFFGGTVTDTTFQKLSKTLSAGIEAGEGVRALSSRVQDVYNQYPDGRALMIARTETTYANNSGMLDQFAQSEVVDGKEWIATMDSVTRESHAEVDGEIVAVDESFGNGLQYPGDAVGDAGEVINCRCALAPAILDRSNT